MSEKSDIDPEKYTRIIADPPWRYGSARALVGTGGKGATLGASKVVQVDAAAQYPCMGLDEICALPIEGLAAGDAMLFMWVTNAFLADGAGARVVNAWGFTPKTVLTWAKVKKGAGSPSMKVGHWFRGASEHVIVGVRGRPRRPVDYPAFPTWFPHERLPHSVKPTTIHDYAEASGEGPYLELFARRPHPGWHVWGNEL